MKKISTLKSNVIICIALILLSLSNLAYSANNAILLTISGAIGPATQDYIQHGLSEGIKKHAKLIILQLNTPGGLETSMRGINQLILASPIPVITYVAPSGARAASAGTFILYASHIAAMAPGTNIGAASPVSIGGIPEVPSDEKQKKSSSTMEKKTTNDALAYIRSLAEIRGRNSEWGEKAIREAATLSANEALKFKVIDVIANNIPDLLIKINDKTVKVNDKDQKLQTQNVTIEEIKPSWRAEFLSIITDPNVAYILLLIGIYGIFFEFYNPGFVLPGVIGGISLLLALYAFQLLPLNYAGFALLLLGIIFMIAEVFVSSFGVLGIGGLIAFIFGSIFLLNGDVPGYSIAWQLILVMSIISGLFFLAVVSLAVSSSRRKVVSGREGLIGAVGTVIEATYPISKVRIQGEIWQARSDNPLKLGEKVVITEVTDLHLTVKPTLIDNTR